jgi:sporulation protein YlmC with PRC-barrel domain
MDEIAGWIAPIATAVAAIMTASNLGTRVTGWGFVVFSISSLAWIIVALATDQTNLLLTNGFLMLVNIVGIWRWLGRQATYDKGARAAEADSGATTAPDLFQLGALQGKPVSGPDGKPVGHVVDAMAECGSGHIAYLVVREGSEAAVANRLHMLSWQDIMMNPHDVKLGTRARLEDLPEIEAGHWPARA